MIFSETDPRFEVRESTLAGAGTGLFAKLRLSAGELLEVRGVLVEADSAADRCTGFADRHKFRIGPNLIIPLGFAGMANHSDQPNLEKFIAGDRVFLRLLNSVEAGEELFWKYGEEAKRRTGIR